MVVLAPVSPWIPKDDLLLKNAIEAGASLESLARGAIQFSRRFTMKELQDRWHTLLYDPAISVEATSRMVEFERSSNASKADNSKDAKCGHGKRKAESIRRCYYAIRRRICNEQLTQGDLSFLIAPSDNCFITGSEGPGPRSMLGDLLPTHHGLEAANFDDLHHVYSKGMTDSVPPHSQGDFPPAQHNTLEHPIQQKIVQGGVTGIAAKTGPSEKLLGRDIFQANGLPANSVCDSKGIECSGFGGINSSITDCETSLDHMQYASSPPAMPEWKSNDGMHVPQMPDDGSIRGNDMQPRDPFCVPCDGDTVNRTPGYHTDAETQLNNQMSCADLKDSADCKEGYFAELSDSLFNFTSENEMLIIDGGKDEINKTYLGLSSLLLNLRDGLNEDTLPDIPHLKEPVSAEEYHGARPISGVEENNDSNEIQMEQSCNINQINFESQKMTSPSTVNPEFPEFRDGVIWCTLNIEDPEIPCDDDLPLPRKPRQSSVLRRTQSEHNNPSYSSKDSSGNQTTMKMESKRTTESHSALKTTDFDALLNGSVDDSGVDFEVSRGETHNGFAKLSACQSSVAVKNESLGISLVRHPSFDVLEKSGHFAATSSLPCGCGGLNQEAKTSLTSWDQGFYAPDSSDPLAVEPGEQLSASDTDIPCFSDIESMILDMDLGPEDQDSFYSLEAAKYQNEDAKRLIIRLEQNAHSYMQRAIASHGAFAILYGRHSRHYIKKPEVLLGRGTDDVPVDIDLSREGRANKISRRQAIIKLEKDGTFILRNMGKCSIYVNSKEVFPGLTLVLQSNCLIEIRGMTFIFETNLVLAKKYLDNTPQRSVTKRLKV